MNITRRSKCQSKLKPQQREYSFIVELDKFNNWYIDPYWYFRSRAVATIGWRQETADPQPKYK